jgi:putative nucleic acid modification protein with dual OB domain
MRRREPAAVQILPRPALSQQAVSSGEAAAAANGLNDGSKPAILDVIRIDASRTPEPHQPENWRISGAQWQHLGRLKRRQVKPLLQRAANPGPYLLGSPLDRISYEYLVEHPIQSSLCLTEPVKLLWRIKTNVRGNRQVRAIFSLAGAEYNLSVSDPAWEDSLSDLGIGSYDNAGAGISASQSTFLTVSLTEPFNGNCFKLINCRRDCALTATHPARCARPKPEAYLYGYCGRLSPGFPAHRAACEHGWRPDTRGSSAVGTVTVLHADRTDCHHDGDPAGRARRGFDGDPSGSGPQRP